MSGAVTFGDAVLRIAPDQIFIPKRLGLYFPDKAAALGALMAVHGQRTPITVRKSSAKAAQPWTLVVGMHRLNGALIENLPLVFALERIGGTANDALDEEASENLDRRDQPPLERAIFIHATCEAAKARLGGKAGLSGTRALAAKARWNQVKTGEIRAEQALQEESDDAWDTMSHAYGWQESVAEAFGRDVRTIRRALKLYRLVIEPFPGSTQALSDHPVVGNNAAQLKAIAEIQDEAQRRAVIEALLGNSELSADEARVAVGIDSPKGAAEQPVHQKYVNAVTGNLARLTASLQKRHLPSFVTALKSDEVKRALRDLLNEELGHAR